jgi:hypothetical protein
MAKAVIGGGDVVDVSTVTASSELSTLPAGSLTSAPVSHKWRSNNQTTTWVRANFASQQSIAWIALGGTNLTAAATVRVRVSTADATGVAGDAYDTSVIAAGVDPNYGLLLHIPPTPRTGICVRLDLVDTSVPYHQAGRLWAGAILLRPFVNYGYGASDIYEDLGDVGRARSGAEWVEEIKRLRGFQMTFPGLSPADKIVMESLMRVGGLTRDWLLCKDTASDNLGRDSVVGLARELTPVTNSTLNRHTVRLTVFPRQ